MEIVPYGGWPHCAKLSHAGLELLVTLDVGPRVLFFGREGGSNEFVVHEEDAGLIGSPKYHSYGGHRLWIAPEHPETTYQIDNSPVEAREEDGWSVFRSEPDVRGLQKELWIRPNTHGGFDLSHHVENRGFESVELAIWALTQMAVGGELLVPQAPFVPWTERLLPARPLVLWGYTRLSDPRYTLGDRVLRLRYDRSGGPTKFGMLVEQGFAAYANHGNVFLKRFGFEEGKTYPDFNSNFESYTRHDMLEVETLGPLLTLKPGEGSTHAESWYLILDEKAPTEDEACADWLARLAESRPLFENR